MNKRRLKRILRESIRVVLKEEFFVDGLWLHGPGVQYEDDSISFQSSKAVVFQCEDGSKCYVWIDRRGTWCIQCDSKGVYDKHKTLEEVVPTLEEFGCKILDYGNIPW